MPDSGDINNQACPTCRRTDRQVKAGLHNGAQRVKCMHCGRRYIPESVRPFYAANIREQAITLQREGMSMREVGRRLGINPRTVVNWVHAESAARQNVVPANHAIGAADPSETLRHPVERRAARTPHRNTIADVALAASVSTTTVSNFLNDRGRMSSATRDRVREAMASLHFTPNSLIRAIRQRRTHIIGVVTYGLYNLDETRGTSITRGLLSGINRGADRHTLNVLLYTGWPHRVTRTTGLEFLDGHIDGLVWVAPSVGEPHLITVVDSGLPTVGLLSSRVPADAAFVAADNADGIRQVVVHLLELGHRRIAYVGPNDVSDFIERAEAYLAALADQGIEPEPCLMQLVSEETNWSGYEERECEAAVGTLLELPNPPTAIIVGNDQLASRAIDRIMSSGLRVPDDVSVTGFDDSVLSARLGMTSVRQDFNAMGESAVDALVRLIDGASSGECRIRHPVSLIVRNSTGPARVGRSRHLGTM